MLKEWEEVCVPSTNAASRSEYRWLGLTDAAILELLSKEIALLTVDRLLHIAAANAELESYNFNHIREERFGM